MARRDPAAKGEAATLEEAAARLPRRWDAQPDAGLARFEATAPDGAAVHLYAGREAGEAIVRALRELPGLLEQERRRRAELEGAHAEMDALREASRAATATKGKPPAVRDGADAALGAMISAPFRPSPAASAAAREDPLAALAVQVAKALAPGARDVERARLIAMAFAASRSDLDGFWAARRQRGGGGKKRAKG